MSQNKLLYTIYLNLHEYITYRNLECSESPKSYTEFEKFITNYNYISIDTTEDTHKIILVYNEAELIKLNEMKKIMKNFKKYEGEIILITHAQISNAVLKTLNELYEFSLVNFKYALFKIVFPKHILCPKHSILSKDEEDQLLNKELYTIKNKLSIIKLNDPMCIWIGAKVNDVVKIERYSESVGLSYYYRIVKL